MANRRLVVGDVVVIRPKCAAKLSREWGFEARAHGAFQVRDTCENRRRCLRLQSMGVCDLTVRWAWPSEVRLADGRAERLDVRCEEMAREIEAEKAARREERMRRGKGAHRRRKEAAPSNSRR